MFLKPVSFLCLLSVFLFLIANVNTAPIPLPQGNLIAPAATNSGIGPTNSIAKISKVTDQAKKGKSANKDDKKVKAMRFFRK